tara:strand:- start:963 stop:1199 length:237 start_codon:yes stop_codon:yes gene_type:complete
MPKVLQCANCRKKFLYSTYQLIAHFEKCVLEVKNDSIRKTVHVTKDDIKRIKQNMQPGVSSSLMIIDGKNVDELKKSI